MNDRPIYCIDTSSLITGFKRLYPAQVFVGLWRQIDALVEEGRLRAPEEVYRELEDQDDELTKWIKRHRTMFIAPDYYQTAVISQIAVAFPSLSKSKVSANTADPWVIALAESKGYIVVSEERGGSVQNPKIPQMCQHYRLTHISFLSIVLNEGWVFR